MRVNVEIDAWEILDELSTSEIEEELKTRKDRKSKKQEDAEARLLEDALSAVKRGDAAEAIFLLERVLYPKFTSYEESQAAYATARKAMQ